MKMRSTALALIFAAGAATPALAQTVEADVIALNEWSYDELYTEGMSADNFIDEVDVHDVDGEEIGDVEDLIADQNGEIVAVVAEVGGFWDIGDTHVAVPWGEVEMADGRITLPVTEDNIDDYGLFDRDFVTGEMLSEGIVADVDDAETGSRTFRLSELIGDYARLRGDDDAMVNYGYVRDVMIQDGRIAAVVVNPDVGYGAPGYYTAYPYSGRDYAPGSQYYDMPYSERDIGEMREFDYDRVELM